MYNPLQNLKMPVLINFSEEAILKMLLDLQFKHHLYFTNGFGMTIHNIE